MMTDDDDELPNIAMMPAGSNSQKLRCVGCGTLVGQGNDVWFKGVGADDDGTAKCMHCVFQAATDHLIAEHGGKN